MPDSGDHKTSQIVGIFSSPNFEQDKAFLSSQSVLYAPVSPESQEPTLLERPREKEVRRKTMGLAFDKCQTRPAHMEAILTGLDRCVFVFVFW
jgi:hypothetical protein